MPLCEAPFYPNDTNYVNDTEHDSNNRKMWFLVLDYGLFTKKADADALQADFKILPFFHREDAEERWADHCRLWHTHSGDNSSSSSSSESVPTTDATTTSAHPAPPTTPVRPAPHAAFRAKTPVSPNSARKKHVTLKAGARVKEEARAPVKREPKALPLFMDDDSPPTKPRPRSREVGPIANKRAKPASVQPPHLRSKSASAQLPNAPRIPQPAGPARSFTAAPARTLASPKAPATPQPPHRSSDEAVPVYVVESGSEPSSPGSAMPPHGISPSVSSVSSVSSASVSELSALLPLRTSASRGPSPRSHVHRLLLATRARVTANVEEEPYAEEEPSASGSGPLLFNSSTRILYKDVAKAVREMGKEESVEVVDIEDVADFLSARAGKKAGGIA